MSRVCVSSRHMESHHLATTIVSPINSGKAIGSVRYYYDSSWNYKIGTVAKYTNRITASEPFEFLVTLVTRIPLFANQSAQIQGKSMRQFYFATVSICLILLDVVNSFAPYILDNLVNDRGRAIGCSV